jgi:AsmA protein
MAGILDNPDAAYAKLREMGQGLFGKDGGGLSGLLGGLSGGGQTGGATTGGAAPSGGGLNELLGGRLGETLGNLIQQGLGQGGVGQGGSVPPPAQRPSQGRSLAAPTSPVPAVPQQSETNPPEAQDNPAMNEVLRQLFNR